jgi:hypothetical protein
MGYLPLCKEARRIAANIAKLPELSRALSSGVNHKLT